MGLPEAWPDVPQLAEPSLPHPRQFLLSPTQAGLPSPQRDPHSRILLKGEELERVDIHPACKEAGSPRCPTDFPGIQIKGKERPWRLSPLLTSLSNLVLRACHMTSVAEQRPRPLLLPLASDTLGGRLRSAFCQGP